MDELDFVSVFVAEVGVYKQLVDVFRCDANPFIATQNKVTRSISTGLAGAGIGEDFHMQEQKEKTQKEQTYKISSHFFV